MNNSAKQLDALAEQGNIGVDQATANGCYDCLDLLPQGLCVLDRELIVHAWNQTLVDWTGIPKEQAIGLDLGKQFSHLRAKKYYPRIQQVIDTGSPALFSAALHRNFIPVPTGQAEDSSLMVQQTLVCQIKEDSNKALLQIQNVTPPYLLIEELRRDRDRSEDSLEDLPGQAEIMEDSQIQTESLNHSKCDFLASMNHEIRTPMTTILGYVEILLEKIEKREDIETLLTIKRNGAFLLQVINDILELSKIESGRLKMESIPCSTKLVVEDSFALIQDRADKKELPLELEYVGDIPEFIETDPLRLKQVLVHLLSNAIKFTSQGSVKLRVEYENSGVDQVLMQFEVSDTGVGISDQSRKKLFQPFFQTDASTSRNFCGNGLGLTISLRLAEMLGGTIELKTKLNEGSTFTFTITAKSVTEAQQIALLSEQKTPQELFEETSASAPLKTGGRILVAEDGNSNQRFIKHVLERAGAKIQVVENGREAIDTVLKAIDSPEPFDIILMDMQMPVLDGYNATRELRARGYLGPIIALTAHSLSSDLDKCLEAGCDAYMTKPFDRQTLVDKITHFLEAVENSEGY